MKNKTVKTRKANGHHFSDEFINSINWEKRDCDLARETGVNPETICQIRRRLGKPRVASPSRKYWSSAKIDWTLTNQQLAKKHKVRLSTAWQWRERVGKPLRDIKSMEAK